jgi:hypothetical protein
VKNGVPTGVRPGTAGITDAWTDVTWLLYDKHVSRAYYVQTGDQHDWDNDSAVVCPPVAQSYLTPGIWNPLPVFEDVQKDHQLRNIQPLDNHFAEAKREPCHRLCGLPRPRRPASTHPPASTRARPTSPPSSTRP